MFKGLAALFTSGAILNPMVLLGVVFGLFLGIKFDGEQITLVYQNYRLYVLIIIIATIYNFLFKRIYKSGGYELDVWVVIGHSIGSSFKMIISSLLAIAFVVLLSFN